MIPLPPIDEQEALCRWIETQCSPIDEAIRRAEDEINLIREYRDRLISDVVTGQIDVRGWEPGPGDEIAEEDLAALTGTEEDDDTPDDVETQDE